MRSPDRLPYKVDQPVNFRPKSGLLFSQDERIRPHFPDIPPSKPAGPLLERGLKREDDDSLTDRQIMDLLQSKDEAVAENALRILMNRYGDLTKAIAGRRLNGIDTGLGEDVANATFTKVWYNRKQYKQEKGTPLSWLLRILHNNATDEWRKQKVRYGNGYVPLEDESAFPRHTSYDDSNGLEIIEEKVDNQALIQHLHQAISQLSKEERTVMELISEGLNHHEIAKKLNCPVGTVHTRARRATIHLRETLKHLKR